MEVCTVVITEKNVIGKKLRRIRDDIGLKESGGSVSVSLKRQACRCHHAEHRCASRRVVSWPPAQRVERVARSVGYPESPGGKSDLAYHAPRIVVGTLLGLISVRLGGIQ